MTITPEVLDGELSLSAAATRLSYLTRKDSENTARALTPGDPQQEAVDGAAEAATDPGVGDTDDTDTDDTDTWAAFHATATALDSEEALELLALGEVISRKAHEHDTAAVRAALLAGADWADIGAALGISGAQAWDAHRTPLHDDELLGARPAG